MGFLRRFLEEREPLLRRKKILGTPEISKQEKPSSGHTFSGQSNEAYCLECIEGHTMKGNIEMGHAIDRYRTAGKMTTGVTEKVRAAIEHIQGIATDVENTKDASPEIKEGLEKILDEVRWIRKDYGVSGKGLTRGYGNLEDLEELRRRIFVMQTTAYALVEQCPSCKIMSQKLGERVAEK